MSTPAILPPSTDNPKEVSIATTLIPWRKDDFRARYMGYLACGFSPDEALYMLGLNRGWLEEQRQDSSFNEVEVRVPEIRKELSKEYIELDFFRNFRLVIEKDYRILKKSIEEEVLSKQEHDYLLKLRSAYSPQQLQILEQVMRGTGTGDWNFAKWIYDNQDKIIKFSRKDEVTVLNRSEIQGESSQDSNDQS